MNHTVTNRITAALFFIATGVLSCLDSYVHVLGNEIMIAGRIAGYHNGSGPLLNALQFESTQFWTRIFASLAFLFLLASFAPIVNFIKIRLGIKSLQSTHATESRSA